MTELTESEIRSLFALQQAHRGRMGRTTPEERRAVLRSLKRGIGKHREALIEALAADLGKSRAEAELTEIHQVIEGINHALRGVASWMRPKRVPGPLTFPGMWSEVVPMPRGTVLILGPWNYPFNNLLSPVVDALAAGNTVIMKPSEKAPATARAIQAMIEDTFEPQLAATVQGDADTAQILTALPFDYILFTGNTEVGRKVMAAASQNLTPVTLELGGKSPVVIDRSADLKLAAQRVAWGKLMNVGQTCISPDHVLVPREQEAEFVRLITETMTAMYGEGGWLRQNGDYGRMIDATAVRRLGELTIKSAEMGAKIELGGEFDQGARFIPPTVVSGVTRDMPLMSQELFGPVLPVLPYDDLEAELDNINRGPTPLAIYAFGDQAATRHIQARTRSGGMVTNGVIVQITDHKLPFGGLGTSGMGNYHGVYGFRTFSHYRTVVHEPKLSTTHLSHAPFDRLPARLTGWLLHKLEVR